MARPVLCGIYRIVNNVNGKCYVGQSVNILDRIGKHFSALRHKRHRNKPIQHAYSKYGEDAFSDEILMVCDMEDLNFYEKEYVRKFNAKISNGYNLTDGGDGNSGWKPPQSVVDASKKKVVLLNDLRIFDSMQDAASAIGVSPSNISHCCNSRTSYAGIVDGVPMVWDFLDAYNHVENKQTYVDKKIKHATHKMNKDEGVYNCRRVVCLNTRTVFDSVTSASQWCGGSSPIHIINVLNGSAVRAYKSKNGEWYTWADYDDYCTMTEEEIIRKIQLANQPFCYKTTPVYCITTNQLFPSTSMASREMGACQSSITQCCQGKLKKAGNHKSTGEPLQWRYATANDLQHAI